MQAAIVTAECQPFIGNAMAPHIIYHRQNPIDLDEVGIIVFVLQHKIKM
jgi:hypothetical protein